jgi:hypothetical protein
MKSTTPYPLLVIAVVDDNPADVSCIARVLQAHGLQDVLQVLESSQRALRFCDGLAAQDDVRVSRSPPAGLHPSWVGYARAAAMDQRPAHVSAVTHYRDDRIRRPGRAGGGPGAWGRCLLSEARELSEVHGVR